MLSLIMTRIKSILGEKLAGLYLGGSLVLGDFDPQISDIDLVAVLTSEVNDKEFEILEKMHTKLVQEYKQWDDRIEVCYISADALKHIKSRTSSIVNISPGEPFHRMESSKKWLMNWYLVREKSIALFGPSPTTIIQPISKQEFIQSVKDHAQSWNKWVRNMHTRSAQAYSILTMCRALYAYTKGDQTSKRKAASWAQKKLPQWTNIIQDALAWRESNDKRMDKAAYSQTEQFVSYVRNQILDKSLHRQN